MKTSICYRCMYIVLAAADLNTHSKQSIVLQSGCLVKIPYNRKFSRQLNFAVLEGRYFASPNFHEFGEFVQGL